MSTKVDVDADHINEIALKLADRRERIDTSHIRLPHKKGPTESSFVSKLIFSWVGGLLRKGWTKGYLEQSDLYNSPHSLYSEKLHNQFHRHWQKELDRRMEGHKPRVWMPFLKILYWKFLIVFVAAFMELSMKTCQAILLGLLSEHFVRNDPSEEETRNAYLFAMGIFLLSLSIAWLHAHLFMYTQEIGMLCRVIGTGAIFHKIFELSQTTIGETSIGRIVNLASTDVQRFDLAFLFTPYIAITPIHIVMVTILLWVYLGFGMSCLAGLFLVYLQIPIQLGVGQLYAKFRLKAAKFTDRRIKVMNEFITGIRVIKMYGWENPFKKITAVIRRSEIIQVAYATAIRAATRGFFNSSVILIMFLILTTYVLTNDKTPSARMVFTSLGLLFQVRITTILSFSQSILGFKEFFVGVKRIGVLLREDLPPVHKSNARRYSRRPTITSLVGENEDLEALNLVTVLRMSEQLPEGETPSINVDNFSATWGKEEGSLTLKGISFDVDLDKRLLAVVGPVGAGKSTILHCLLGELQPISGNIEIIGTLGYTAQDSWIFSGTVRDNILFGKEMDEEWYSKVISACCLKEDIQQFPFRDKTLVGERGVTLSGGQKARINLARSVYRKADVYILDDPLSAVDAAVGRALFEKCINGLLRNSVVILITHQLQYAQLADAMLVINKGEMLAYGTYGEIMALVEKSEKNPKNSAIKMVLQEMLVHMDSEAEKDVFDVEDEVFRGNEGRETESPPTFEGSGLTDTMSLPLMADGYQRSSQKNRFSDADIDYDFELTALGDAGLGSAFPSEALIATVPSAGNIQEATSMHPQIAKVKSSEKVHFGNVVPKEDKAQGQVTLRIYLQYLMTGGSYLGLVLLLVLLFIGEVNIVVADWFVAEWANGVCANESGYVTGNETGIFCNLERQQIIGVYAGLAIGVLIFCLCRALVFSIITANASRVLHNKTFAAVLRAPVRFFDTNPVGRVLNRFSKDMGLIDNVLPYQFYDFITVMLRFLAVVIVAAVANYYVLLIIIPVLIVFWLLRLYYLKPAREIKRLEAISRSPLFSHISETIQGLTTIRACERQKASMAYFHAYQDEHSKGWYLYIAAARWFALRIDIISSLFIGLVAILGVAVAEGVMFDSARISLSVTYAITLAGMFQYGVRLSTEVENIMISVERLMSYGRLDPEASLETPPGVETPPPSWPDQGALYCHKMKFRYSKDTPYVLKGISFDVRPSEKIGIVGRTGAGKSSLMQALFRLAEPEGILEIDGVAITEIGLHDVRQRISVIPQDPVLFSGTIRYNLDPFNQYSDDRIWNALEQVELKDVIQELESKLLAPVTEGGFNFSVGQRQLLCLARALLMRNKIIVIDEATANVDMTTDAIIQQTIRREFVDCTTLTIAHRLNTIMDSDRIMVFSAGHLREFDRPCILLKDTNSLLSKMVENTGANESVRLRELARFKYPIETAV